MYDVVLVVVGVCAVCVVLLFVVCCWLLVMMLTICVRVVVFDTDLWCVCCYCR